MRQKMISVGYLMSEFILLKNICPCHQILIESHCTQRIVKHCGGYRYEYNQFLFSTQLVQDS